MKLTQEEKDRTLKNFMEEMFDFKGLKKIGFLKILKKMIIKHKPKRFVSFLEWNRYMSIGQKLLTLIYPTQKGIDQKAKVL